MRDKGQKQKQKPQQKKKPNMSTKYKVMKNTPIKRNKTKLSIDKKAKWKRKRESSKNKQ